MRRLLAVLGRDVSRSLSPLIHTQAAAGLDLDVAYIPVSCPTRESFHEALRALATLGALGANVTTPYKIDAMKLATELSDAAREMVAVNTLSFRGGTSLYGDNTDGPGLKRVLERLPPSTLERVQVLGAGGASRAAVWALWKLGVDEVMVSSRPGAADDFSLPVVRRWPLAPVPGVSLVISTLPPTDVLAEQALAEFIDRSKDPAILDLSYVDLDRSTPLVERARRLGLHAQDGRSMLAEQGALSLASWTGGEVSRIRQIMLTALRCFDTNSGHD